MNEQIVAIWNSFLKTKKYITIGRFAVNIYGYNRNTGHIDIYLEDTNLARPIIEQNNILKLIFSEIE
ncbi:hypothetical protein NJT12_13340 [Flavobacterium sp. AC]|uniref:Uncharacterized protein n=1 Tax=Flavobacterium azizsancarii TaxID=2961580 RepID=A0ABT4WDI2_9FLAO|nr:hypothetical protein [Flavobacterium azizsancarii]MDA6070606.1 hypothetical protein [Flavobacterium azizsancarii]